MKERILRRGAPSLAAQSRLIIVALSSPSHQFTSKTIRSWVDQKAAGQRVARYESDRGHERWSDTSEEQYLI